MSRDLEEIGAVKVRVPGGETVYALPELPADQVAPEDQLRRVLGEWVVEVAHSANLVVLRTPPGSAHVVGSALDRSGFDGVIGTVAGDDTVLVVAAEDVGGAVVAERIAEVAGTNGTGSNAERNGTGSDDIGTSDTGTNGDGDGEARGARLQRRPRHLGRRALAPGGAGVEVVAVAVDVGQGGDFEADPPAGPRGRRGRGGGRRRPGRDRRATTASPPSPPTRCYEGKYPLVSSLSRPVIVRHLVAEARRHGADAVAHGCTGKGNDQVRFEVGTRALAPDLEIFAPARAWGMTREDCVDYAAATTSRSR